MLKRYCLKWKLLLLGIRKKLKDALSVGADIWSFIFLQDCIFVVTAFATSLGTEGQFKICGSEVP